MPSTNPTPDHIVLQSRATQETAREERFRDTADLVFERHPAYRRIARGLGLVAQDLRSVGDLRKLPVTTKSDYMAAPEDYRLDTSGLDAECRAIWDVMHTTGTTTGIPTPFYSTAYDFYRILAVQEGMMRLRGVGPSDSIANLFPLTVWPHGICLGGATASAPLATAVA